MSFIFTPQQADAAFGVKNLELTSTFNQLLDGDLVVFIISEVDQGMDLNGDGDAEDFGIIHVYDHSTGVTTNLQVGSDTPVLDGNLVAFTVNEIDHGNTDLNGDGDAEDFGIIHVYDHSTGVTTNLGLAGGISAVEDDLIVIVVDELAQGNMDLNNDGDNDSSVEGVYDFVLHVYDHSVGVTTNVGLVSNFSSLDGNLVAFTVSERGQGNIDLNNDGDNGNLFDEDADDEVLHIYDHSTGVTTNLQIVSDTPVLDGNLVAFTVNELNQGDQDLNENNAIPDEVLHIYDHSTGITTNLKMSSFIPTLDGNLVVFPVFEEYPIDLNGDGDAEDWVLHVYDHSTGSITNLQLDANIHFRPIINGDLVLFTVLEHNQGDTDLNGDGDAEDKILHVYDQSNKSITSLKLDILKMPRFFSFDPILDGNLVVFGAFEHNQGDTDLNGDGDAEDFIVHVYDHSIGTTTNLEIDADYNFRPALDDGILAFPVNEQGQGDTDLNGMGMLKIKFSTSMISLLELLLTWAYLPINPQ